MSAIRFLNRRQIDDNAWDATISNSGTGLPYAYSWYLDTMTEGAWSALVQDDYKRIFPLPWNRKLFGLPQIYQPAFSQQLGLFGEGVKPNELSTFLEAIPCRFLRTHLMLHAHEASGLLQAIPGRMRWKMNLVLPLNRTYEEIQFGFSKSLRKRLRKAEQQLRLQEGGSVEDLVDFYRQELQTKVGLSVKHYQLAGRLFQELLQRDMGEIYQVLGQQDQVVCLGIFIKTPKRIINLFGASNQAGREAYAMHFLLAKVIEKYAAQPLLFDFEGSEIPGVAAFFRSFGPEEQPFFAYANKTI